MRAKVMGVRDIIRNAIAVLVFCSSSILAQTTQATPEGDWPIACKDFTCQRFSSLNEINSDNVKSLRVAWTFGPGTNNGHEAAPIVVGSTMYVITSYPNILYALDLNQSGQMNW